MLDLGRFVVRSDHEAAGKLPAEQAALYECIHLEGRDVLAYLVDGEFRWSHEDEVGGASRERGWLRCSGRLQCRQHFLRTDHSWPLKSCEQRGVVG